MKNRYLLVWLCSFIFLVSCSTSKKLVTTMALGKESTFEVQRGKTARGNRGARRITYYQLTHEDIPQEFNNFKIAFISDLHYKSLFTAKKLNRLIRLLNHLEIDALLLGGDYQEGCEYVTPLCDALGKVKADAGKFGVMGNNDYERCYEQIIETMKENGISILEHQTDSIQRDGQCIYITGIRNPFDLKRNGVSPTLALNDDDFVIMLVHTPDYAEQVSIAHTDLVLAGHTHGGQVRIGNCIPIIPSVYGKRFASGLKQNSLGIPLIITNGIGTSRLNIRIGAPSEVVVITLQAINLQ